MHEEVQRLLKERSENKKSPARIPGNRNPVMGNAIMDSGYFQQKVQSQKSQLAALNKKVNAINSTNEFMRRSMHLGDIGVMAKIDWRFLLRALEKLSIRGKAEDYTATDVAILRKAADRIEAKLQEAPPPPASSGQAP